MSTSPPGKGLLGENATPLTQSSHIRHHFVERMPSARHIFLTLLLGLLVTAGLANAILKQQPALHDEDSTGSDADHSGDDTHRDDSTFSRLLSSASPQAIHEFLHAYFPGTYKHGIYDSDHSAMEAVRATDPELATSIVQMAKRQTSNETTVSPTSTQATDSNTLTTSTLDQTTTTTPDTSTTDTTTTSPTTPSETSTVVESITTTSSAGSPTTQPTSDSTTATSTPDSTPGTTTTSSSITSRATRTSTFTSTLPGGAKTTITSVEVVTPGIPDEASTTSGSTGSLQSGFAVPAAQKPMVELVIGVVVGGALLI
ncbi:hypothetical protein GGR53DRAFT_29728 [Hypoxylon sp. FL1150]|nr:hypothetical protein GGR53DRAFT_29728 [Hypoxylon sp. FL1150]